LPDDDAADDDLLPEIGNVQQHSPLLIRDHDDADRRSDHGSDAPNSDVPPITTGSDRREQVPAPNNPLPASNREPVNQASDAGREAADHQGEELDATR
jgi:hypothetical protein